MTFASTLLLTTLAVGSAPVHEISPGRLRPEARILLDTRCGDVEWSGAARVPIAPGSELWALEDSSTLYLCVTLPPESYGTMDLYVLAVGAGAPVNLHASAQVGERTKAEGAWPEWRFGNHEGWYSPPVAVTGASVVDGRARMTFSNTAGREVAVLKSKFGPGPWRFRLEVRALGADKRGSLRFPEGASNDDPSTWAVARLAPPAAAGTPGGADVVPVTSSSSGETRPVWLHTPAECSRSKPCDVLLVLDAHALFPLAVSYSQVMRMMGRMEPLVVAGIPSASQAGRARDFIPTPGLTPSELQRGAEAGTAARFAEFIAKDVLPAIERAAPVSTRRVIAGHSLAGLFAVHVLAATDTFEGHIAISPTLGWGGEKTLDELIARLKAKDAPPRRLYASVANDTPAYLKAFTRLEKALGSAPGWLRHRARRYTDEDHVTTVAPALQDGMKWMYQGEASR